jgi:4-amino-4-deoxy-L-arabinose transferase-like glycosyltransferase
MRKHLPVIALILFISAEAFLKESSAVPTFIPLLIFSACAIYFFFYLRGDQTDTIFGDSSGKWWIICGILLLGFFLRLWKLDGLFDGISFDEAYKGLDAISIREFGERPIFLPWNAGREALVVYLIAFAQHFVHNPIVAARIVNALSNCFLLVVFFLFVKTMFNRNVALLATFFLAVSKWGLIHGRYAYRAGQYTFYEVAALYFLARGMLAEKGGWKFILLSGIFLGLGVHTYIAYRIFALVFILFIFQKDIRSRIRANLKPLLAAAVICAAIVAPLAKYYLENRQSFTFRMSRTTVWTQPNTREQNPAVTIFDSTVKTLGMFTYRGDSLARHNVDSDPMLSPYATAFFVLGFIYAISQWRKKYFVFLILYFLINLLPGILAVGAPHAARTMGSLPPILLFTTLGFVVALQIFAQYSRILVTTVAAIVLGGNFYTGVNDTFIRYPAALDSLSIKDATIWGMDREQANISTLLNQIGDRCVGVVSPMYYFHSAVEYLTYSKSEHQYVTIQPEPLKNVRHRIAVIFLQTERVNLWYLRDDAGKDFFEWWRVRKGIDTETARGTIRKAYKTPQNPAMTNTSDTRLLEVLQERYPHGRLVNYGHFIAYIVKM